MIGRWVITGAALLLLAATACGGGGRQESEADAASMEMTPEEHARMQAGGQGGVDTSGQVLRQPVHLTAAQERALGVVYTTVRRETLTKEIRTVGQIMPAESRLADVTTKIEGFVETLFVNTTGAAVRHGQALLAIYSPMLVAAQEEFLTAKRLVARVDSSAPEAWRGAQATLAAAYHQAAAEIEALVGGEGGAR